MKICLIGHFTSNPDEGMKNLTVNLYNELSKSHEVKKIDIEKIYRHLGNIKKFSPEIIHLVVGPSSILCFLVSKILSLYCKNTKIIMSAPQPGNFYFKKLIPLLKPDLILIQSKESEKFFANLCCKTLFFPNSIDTKKFIPIKIEEKNKLREKYKLDKEKFVILHVGHIKNLRNLSVLKRLQGSTNQVIIVGSTSTTIETGIYKELKDFGCLIWITYFRNIEEIYSLSDCYVFPTVDKSSCIETPMSVLEAMSCNLPVITTKYKALPALFSEGDGLFFVDNDEDVFNALKEIKNPYFKTNTRHKVLQFSSENVTKILENIYTEKVEK